jgi:hypothetical protein
VADSGGQVEEVELFQPEQAIPVNFTPQQFRPQPLKR